MSDWDEARAVAYLLRLLSRRDYARAELDERMRRKEIDPDVRRAALERLAELDLLDDRRVAEGHVRGRVDRKGRLALAREMARRGLEEDVREVALAPLDEAQQLAAARGVIAKNAWRFASGDRRKDRAKAATFLARRGFEGDVVRAAVDAWAAQLPDDAAARDAAATEADEGDA